MALIGFVIIELLKKHLRGLSFTTWSDCQYFGNTSQQNWIYKTLFLWATHSTGDYFILQIAYCLVLLWHRFLNSFTKYACPLLFTVYSTNLVIKIPQE